MMMQLGAVNEGVVGKESSEGCKELTMDIVQDNKLIHVQPAGNVATIDNDDGTQG